jgi:hypothetical protein
MDRLYFFYFIAQLILGEEYIRYYEAPRYVILHILLLLTIKFK